MDDFPLNDGGGADEIALEDMLAEYSSSGGVMVKFYRLVKDGGVLKEFLLEEYEPSAFNFIEAARAHGGNGSYRVKVYDWNDTRTRKCAVVNKTLHYGGGVTAPAATPPAAMPHQGESSIAMMIAEGFKTLAAQLGAAQANKQIDPTEVRRQTLEDMRVMLEIAGARGPAAGAAPAQSVGLAEIMTILKTGMELGRGNVPGDGDSSLSFANNLLETFGKPLADVVTLTAQERAKRGAAPAAPGAPAAPPALGGKATAGAESAPQASGTHNAGENNVIGKHMIYLPFKGYIEQLVGLAAQQRDPALYADLAIDNMTDQQLDAILADDQLIDNFAKIVPQVATYRPWMEEFLAAIKGALIEEPAQDAGAGGHVIEGEKPGKS